MATVRFNTDKKKIKNSTALSDGTSLANSNVVYTTDISKVKRVASNTIVVSQDTGEIFIGMGTNTDMQKLSDVKSYAGRENFPEKGVTGKIYISEDSNNIYFWNGEKYVTAAGSGSDVSKEDAMTKNDIDLMF